MGDKSTHQSVLVPLGVAGSVALSVALRRWFEEERPELGTGNGDDRDETTALLDWLADHDFGIGRWHRVPEPH